MSIAELIMQGTNRSSESTAWVGDSLAKLGQNVGQALAQREQQKQAQEMLPFLQQNLQVAMADAQQGRSGQAYSRLIGSLDPQTLNNPQLANFVKLGFDAIGKSTDDYLYKQKASQGTGTTLADMYAMQMMGIPLPTGGGGVGGGAGGNQIDATTPLPETDIQAGGATFVEPEDDVTRQPMPGEPMVVTTPATAKAKPTPAQEKATEFVFKNEAIAETQGVPKAWYNQAIDPESPKIKELSQTHEPINLEGGDKFGFGTVYLPIQRDQEMTITGKGNDFNFSKTVNRRDPRLAEDRVKFIQNMNTALAIADGSQEMQTLLDQYGSVENFPKYKTVKEGIAFPLKEKIGNRNAIILPKGTSDSMGPMEAWRTLQNAPGMGRTLGILIARSEQMPEVGGGRDIKSLEGKIGTDPKTGKQFKIVNGRPVPL
jgi:hypothetical protein